MAILSVQELSIIGSLRVLIVVDVLLKLANFDLQFLDLKGDILQLHFLLLQFDGTCALLLLNLLQLAFLLRIHI